jgi:hypothetical protein
VGQGFVEDCVMSKVEVDICNRLLALFDLETVEHLMTTPLEWPVAKEITPQELIDLGRADELMGLVRKLEMDAS